MLNIDISGVIPFIKDDFLMEAYAEKALAAHTRLINSRGARAEYTGWLRLPAEINADELSVIKKAALDIRGNSQILVVVGVGGSSSGAKAVVELLHPRANVLSRYAPQILFAGDNLSGSAMKQLFSLLDEKDFSINIISKSGASMETIIAFCFLRQLLAKRYSKEDVRKRIYITTDSDEGDLLKIAKNEGCPCFVFPKNVGGRYSVFTPSGLLPIASAEIDIDNLLSGARSAMESLLTDGSKDNPALRYAATRQMLYSMGKKIEVLSYNEPSFRSIAGWWRQLFGESEGKEQKGIFPACMELTADLHSMGQYMQDGERIIFETFLSVQKSRATMPIPSIEDSDIDYLNILAGKDLDGVNAIALSTAKASHIKGGIPCIDISLDTLDETCVGELLYFFKVACAISGYISGINPFDQPGAEIYKKNMRQLF